MTAENERTTITSRLREVGRRSDLATSRRLAAKIDSSATAVTRRLRTQSRLRDACLRWTAIGRANDLHRGDDRPKPAP